MYDEAGITSGGSSGGGVTSADLGGGPSFGGDSGYDSSVTYQPTTAALGALGPGQVGDSGITTILNKIKGYVGERPTLSRGIGTLFGNIVGNLLMPGIGGLIGGYLGNRQGTTYSNQYNLNREAMSDLLGGEMNQSNIYQPSGIATLNNTILDSSILTSPNRSVYYYPDAPNLNQDQYTLYP